MWVKSGATSADLHADYAGCVPKAEQANGLDASHAATAAFALSGAGLLPTVAAYFIVKDLADRDGGQSIWVGRQTFHHCMEDHGWAWLPLSAQEQADLPPAKPSEARAAWTDRFLAGDLSARIAAAKAPVVPPLPEERPALPTFDGVYFDPGRLTVAKGIVGDDGLVMSGEVHMTRMARQRSRPGGVFYEVVGRARYDRDTVFWCGPFDVPGTFATGKTVTCVTSSDDGYDLWRAEGGPPIAAIPVAHGQTIREPGLDLSLEPADQDLIGAMKFTLRVRYVNEYNIQLEADVFDGKRKSSIWKTMIAYDPNGVAVLPFWSHRLELHKVVGQGVLALFTPKGDGTGWLDARPPQ
jgi:hypothetical protein